MMRWLCRLLGPLLLLPALAGADVVVTVTFPDGSPAEVAVYGAYQAPGGAHREGLRPVRVDKGVYRFDAVPAAATRLSLVARLDLATSPALTRQQWSFSTPSATRAVSMRVAPATRVHLFFTDAHGQPLADMPVRGEFRYATLPLWDDTYWANTPRTSPSNRALPDGLRSDALGMLDAGLWPGRSYTLRYFVGTRTGPPVPFTVGADGAPVTVRAHATWGPRTVTMTAPPGEVLHAHYLLQHTLGARDAVADAAGQVVWEALPPVRVVVWGAHTPVGVIPPDARHLTGALPAPPPDNFIWVSLAVRGAGAQPAPLRVFLNSGAMAGPRKLYPYPDVQYRNAYQREPSGRVPMLWNLRVDPGKALNVLVVLPGPPLRVGWLLDWVGPYAEYGQESIGVDLPLTPGVELRGTLHGGALPGERVTVTPVALTPPLPQPVLDALASAQPAPTVDAATGAFHAWLPAPGTYRVILAAGGHARKSTTVSVPAAGADVRVTLP